MMARMKVITMAMNIHTEVPGVQPKGCVVVSSMRQPDQKRQCTQSPSTHLRCVRGKDRVCRCRGPQRPGRCIFRKDGGTLPRETRPHAHMSQHASMLPTDARERRVEERGTLSLCLLSLALRSPRSCGSSIVALRSRRRARGGECAEDGEDEQIDSERTRMPAATH